MKKKKILAVSLATMMALATIVSATGCKIMETDPKRDMDQVIAKVDITQSDDFKAGGEFEAYADLIPELTIRKRDLVAYFVNSGYSYVSQGYTYEKTFELLVESMVDYNIIIQYAMAYFFKDDPAAYPVEEYKQAVAQEGADKTYETLKFFLTHGEEGYKADVEEETGIDGVTRYDMAVYQMNKSINSAIDSRESANYLQEDSHLHNEDITVQTVPDGIDTEKTYYYQSEADYTVYTGWNTIPANSAYEKQSGSTKETRKKAFASYVSMLASNHLLKEGETVTTILSDGIDKTAYYRTEMITQMEGMLSSKLNDAFEKKAEEKLTDSEIVNRFNKLKDDDRTAYDKDTAAFATAMDGMSDSSFILCSPKEDSADDYTRYGFVYNILLPFSTTQGNFLKQEQSASGAKDKEGNYTESYYKARRALLEQVKGTDQRGGWIAGETDYSYISQDHYGSASDYLFFENNTTESKRYEELLKYYGKYPYNGTVAYDSAKKEYTLTPNKLSVTNFIEEMEGYMNYALDGTGFTASGKQLTERKLYASESGHGVTTGTNGIATSYGTNLYKLNSKGKKEIDYSDFVYYVGQVAKADGTALATNNNSLFVNSEENVAYTAMSAFNELQFAYSTDPGCLNKYLGYSISKYDTQFMKEFEYAAKLACSLGVGAYTVAPTDYGWHIIYCTFTFNGGDVYGEYNVANKTKKNTFEYYFYEAMKSSIVKEYQQVMENKKINEYNTDGCVTIWKDRYSDYTVLDKTGPDLSQSSNGTAQQS